MTAPVPPTQGLTAPLAEHVWARWGLWLALGTAAVAGWLGGLVWGLGVLASASTVALIVQIQHERQLRYRMAAGTEAMSALDIPLLILDHEDRLRWSSAAFARLYPGMAPKLRRGMPYAEIARMALESGTVDYGNQEPETWLRQRLASRGPDKAEGVRQQRMKDGRVLQVIERRTASNGWASVRFDIGELMATQDQLREARDQAQAATEMLEEALEAMPVGFEIWDAEDRLVTCNHRVREQYPTAAHLLTPGVAFETVVRASLAAGAIPSAQGREAQWLGDRLANRGRLGRPFLMDYQGHWIQVEERRMPSGRLVTVRQDVTELVGARNALTQARQLAEQRHQLLARAVDALPIALEIWDPQGKLQLVNRLFRQWHPQVDYDRLIGSDFESTVRVSQSKGMLPREAQGREEEWIRERVARHGNLPEGMLAQLPDGRRVLTQESRTPEGFVVTVRQDVTALLEKERALESSQAQIEAIIRTAGAAILTIATDGRVLYANPAAESLWGYSSAELIGRAAVMLLQPAARAEPLAQFDAQVKGATSSLVGPRREMLARHKDGHELVIQAAISEVHTANEHFFVGVVTDISEPKRLEAELRRANERLEHLSLTDSLTELANRRRMIDALQELWRHALRDQSPLAVLMVDVDHFKRYNDHHGHQAGDAALREIAAVLREAARRGTDVVARYGGEEFALLLDHCDSAGALERAEQIRAALARRKLPHGASPLGRLSVSIGVFAAVPAQGSHGEQWLGKADAALYQAKAEGRDRVVALPD